MCDLAESTIQELLLAKLASPENQAAGATQGDLLHATQAQGACVIHSLSGLRALLRKGHVTPESTPASEEPETDPNARWRIAGAPASSQEPASVGENGRRRLGNYTYLPSDVLGRGKLGTVVRGRNEFLRRDVAIKFLSPEFTTHADFRRRFEREALILANLNHPNIVKLHDGGQAPEGTFYIAMEYIDGGTLVDLSKKLGRAPASLVARVMYHVASALAAAHRHGVLHRDVKLDNVMMTQDGPKLTDFNLSGVDQAAVREVPSALEAVASEVGNPPKLVGTLPYMSPERINGERGDLRSDIYSLGATFYAFACGGRLFEGVPVDDYMGWRWHHNKETPQALTDRVPGFPPALAAIIHRCLARDPDERYPRYEELLQDLAAVTKELPAPPGTENWSMEPPWEAAVGDRRRFPVRRVAASLVLAALVAFLFLNPFGKPAQPTTNPPHASKAEANPQRPEANRIPESAEPEPPRPVTAPKPASESTAPDAESKPPPRLRDKLLSSPTVAATQTTMARLQDWVGGHYSQFRTLSYDAAQQELHRFRETIPAGDKGVAGPEREYLRAHVDAAATLLDLARGTADTGWRRILSAQGKTRIRLADGNAFEGTLASVADGAPVVVSAEGQRLSLDFHAIDPREFQRDGAPAVPQLAFQILSIGAVNGLGEILKSEASDETTLLWIPLAARLARLEVYETAKRAAARAKKLLLEKKPGEDLLAEISEYMEVLGRVRTMRGLEQPILGLYPYLATEFSAAKDEEDALNLLVARDYSRILTNYRSTASYGPAAELLVGGFQSQIASAHNDLMAKTGWIEWDWMVHPPPKPPQKSLDYWYPDVRLGTSILRDPDGIRTLIMGRDHPRAPEGVVLTVEFAALAARSDEPHWRFHLRGEKGSNTYLRFDEKKIALCRTILNPGIDDEMTAISVAGSGQGVYSLIPRAQELHLFKDGKHVLSVPRAHAAIPQRLSLSVMKGSLTIKQIQVLKK